MCLQRPSSPPLYTKVLISANEQSLALGASSANINSVTGKETTMITLHELETLIPFVKPLFDGLRTVKDFFGKRKQESIADGRGGRGGSGTIIKGEGVILGGRGGRGGHPDGGRGGDGGSGTIIGGKGVIVGGDGGEAAQYGRPGLGAESPLTRLGLGDIVLPDGRKLSEFGRGGDGGAPPIQHEGRFYNIAALIRDLPRETIYEIDETKPSSTQEWWNRFVLQRPHLAAEIISKAEPIH